MAVAALARATRAVATAPARAAEPGSTNRARIAGQAAKTGAVSVRGASSALVDVSSSLFEPSQAVAEEIEKAGARGLDVRVVAKGLTEEGIIRVRQDRGKKFHSIGLGTMPLLNPWTQKLGGMYLNFAIDNSAIKDGYAAFKPRGGDRNGWLQALQQNPALLGGLGLKLESLPKPVNRFEQGKLVLGVAGIKVVVGGYVDATFDVLLENMEAPKINGSAEIDIRGVAKGRLAFDNPGNVLRGAATLGVNFKSFSGAVQVAYRSDGTVDISGTAAYNANKLSGEIQFVATDLDTANKFATDAIAAAGGKENVQNAGPPSAVPVPREGKKKRGLAATGRLSFNLTNWFAGSVQVVVDGKGDVTVIGKIAPPGEIILFGERSWNKDIVKFEAKAYYGIPVLGNLNLFANISLVAIAKLGPARLCAIEILGTYSTDPAIQKNIQISGSINISAYGGLRLRAEGGAGIEILAHDLKFGIGLNADVGVKAYADARPTIGYRDPGVFYISGTLDLVAQPVLGLGGEFFIELDAPWFSPLSDHRWSWPLFSKEWPLGDPIGMSATLKDYVLGSGKIPEIELKPPECDATNFLASMVDDKLPNRSGGTGAGRGTFKEDGSVPKPVVRPKRLPPPVGARLPKKGAKTGVTRSARPDAKAANEAKSTAILQKAAKPLGDLRGRSPLTRLTLDRELGKIGRQASGIDFGVRPNGAKWLISPKAGRIGGKSLEVAAKREEGASGAETAGAKGASGPGDWWKEKQVFTNRAGERHTLCFIGTGSRAKLGIRSEEMTIETYLDTYPGDKGSDDWKMAKSIFDRERRIIFTPQAKSVGEKARRKQVAQALADIMTAFARLSGALPKFPGDYEKTKISYPGEATGTGQVIYLRGDTKVGTSTSVGGANPEGWEKIEEACLTTGHDSWVRMHIISAELGGDAVKENLIPATRTVNSGPFKQFEHATRDLAKAKSGQMQNMVWATFKVERTGKYARAITGRSGLYGWRGGTQSEKWIKFKKYSYQQRSYIPDAQRAIDSAKISLNNSTATLLAKLRIDKKLVELIRQGRRYGSLQAFVRSMEKRAAAAGIPDYPGKIQAIVNHPDVVLNK